VNVEKMPRLVACGGRNDAYDSFSTAKSQGLGNDASLLWVDSEDPVANIEATWTHLTQRDGWAKPPTSTDEDVLLMVTCMETWLVADRKTLGMHCGKSLNESSLPSLQDIEGRERQVVPLGIAQMPIRKASGRSICSVRLHRHEWRVHAPALAVARPSCAIAAGEEEPVVPEPG
jgi:hypothetical protein